MGKIILIKRNGEEVLVDEYHIVTPAIQKINQFLIPSGTKRNRKMSKHRERLLKIDPTCKYCGIILTVETATIDHVIPMSKGGTNAKDNLVLSCQKCNSQKGSKLAWQE